MPWHNDAQSRRHTASTYGAGWRKARRKALERDRWRCKARLDGCAGAASQVDHIVPVSQGGTHQLDNLRSICEPCHRRVTATQGQGFRATDSERRTADPAPQTRTEWLCNDCINMPSDLQRCHGRRPDRKVQALPSDRAMLRKYLSPLLSHVAGRRHGRSLSPSAVNSYARRD